VHTEHHYDFNLSRIDGCSRRMQSGGSAAFPAIEHCATNVIGPPGAQHDGASHISTLRTDRFLASDPDLVDAAGGEFGSVQRLVRNVSRKIDGMPSTEGVVCGNERRSGCTQ